MGKAEGGEGGGNEIKWCLTDCAENLEKLVKAKETHREGLVNSE